MEGTGCYDDFVNACKWIDPKVKEDFKGKLNYKYFDESVIVVASTGNLSSTAITDFNLYVR